MEPANVQSPTGITLVGGGEPQAEDIVNSMALAPTLVAVDGGANFCVAQGLFPVAVVGDFDSVSNATQQKLPDARMIEIPEQISTDFEKALTSIEAPFVLATGFTDGRLDHTLAVFSVLARRVGPPTILVGRHDIAFAAPDRLTLETEAGVRLSLFPMVPITGRSTGLEWPIDGLTLDPMGRIGTSNTATGPVTIEFDQQGCVVIMPRESLGLAIAALTD